MLDDYTTHRFGARVAMDVNDREPHGLRAVPARARSPRVLRYLRLATATWFLVLLVLTPTRAEFLLDPGRIGNDVSNYLAAGERLNAGHQLYRLVEGDRPVPAYPPYYDVPLVSPPPTAVVWRALDLLPEPIVVYGWWLGGLAVTTLATLWVIRRGPAGAQILVFLLAPELAWTALSGNVSAYVVGALVAAWVWQVRAPVVAGILAALASVARLTPLLLGWWGLVVGRARLVLAMGAALIAAAGISLLGAGWDNHVEWMEVARYTATTGARDESVAGILRGLGLDPAVAGLAGPAVMLLAAVSIVVLRGRPAIGWSVAAIAMVAASPVTHQGSLALLLAIAAATIPPFQVKDDAQAVPSAPQPAGAT